MKKFAALSLLVCIPASLVFANESANTKTNLATDLLTQAYTTAQTIPWSHTKALRLADIGKKLTLAGAGALGTKAFDQASALASAVEIVPRAEIEAQVAIRLAEAGLFAKSLVAARSIQAETWRGAALAEIAGLLAKAGKQTEAINTASEITHADAKAQALSEVAFTLSGAQNLVQDTLLERIARYRELYKLQK